MDCTLRLEEERDYSETENMTREAFWDLYKPGCNEHLLVRKLRQVDAFVKELDYVAIHNSQIIGNIMYSKADVINTEGVKHEVLCLGPVTVLPEYQNKGIGKILINETLKKARELQFKGVFLMGNPPYYSRFGFKNAEAFNVRTSDGGNFNYFMGLELAPGSLQGISGRFHEDNVFNIDEKELEEFEKGFPFKEKHVTDTQLK